MKFTQHTVMSSSVPVAASPSLVAVQCQTKKHGEVKGNVAKARKLGHMPGDERIEFVVELRLRDTRAMKQFITSLYDASSPNFHHFLQQGEFFEQFGPTASQYDTVVGFLQQQGFCIRQSYDSRLLVDVAGSVAQIERAFRVSIDKYFLNGKTYYAPDREVMLPKDISTLVQAVVGLDNFSEATRLRTACMQRDLYYAVFVPDAPYVYGRNLGTRPQHRSFCPR